MSSNNHRLGSGLGDLNPRLSLLYQVGDDVIRPCKNAEDARYMPQD